MHFHFYKYKKLPFTFFFFLPLDKNGIFLWWLLIKCMFYLNSLKKFSFSAIILIKSALFRYHFSEIQAFIVIILTKFAFYPRPFNETPVFLSFLRSLVRICVFLRFCDEIHVFFTNFWRNLSNLHDFLTKFVFFPTIFWRKLRPFRNPLMEIASIFRFFDRDCHFQIFWWILLLFRDLVAEIASVLALFWRE